MSYTSWNPYDCDSRIFLSYGNLIANKPSETNTWRSVRASTFKSSGKWYFEIKVFSLNVHSGNYGDFIIGVGKNTAPLTNFVGFEYQWMGWVSGSTTGSIYYNNVMTNANYGNTLVIPNDIIMIALDIDAGKLWFGKNEVWFNSGDPATGANPAFSGVTGSLTPMLSLYSFTTPETRILGQFTLSDQSFSPPSGFNSWGTKLPFNEFLYSLYKTSSTSLLLHFDGTNNSTTIIDSSFISKSVTAFGNVKISNTQSKFGGTSAYFDGSGDYLTIPDSTEFQLSFDFTIETFIYPTALTSAFGAIVTTRRNNNATLTPVGLFLKSSGKLELYASSNGSSYDIDVIGTSTLVVNNWYHVVACRSGNTWRLFVNGVADGTTTSSITPFNGSGTTNIGGDSNTNFFTGYIDELRIINGVALYTVDFTPPLAPLKVIDFSNLLSYWKLDESNGVTLNDITYSTDFIDNSTTPKPITLYGNTQLSTTQYKFGGSSVYFDGTGDYLSCPAHSDFLLGTGDFTIEMWINLNLEDMPAWSTLIQIGTDASNGVFDLVRYNSSNPMGIRVDYYNSGWFSSLDILNADIQSNTWHHIALTRQSNTFRFFVDGILKGSNTISINYFQSNLFLGGRSNGNTPIKGYIDEFRLIKGTAIYTANFTVPTSELSNPSSLLLHFNFSTYPLIITGTPTFSQTPLLTMTEGTSIDFAGASASGNFISLNGLSDFIVGLFIKTSTSNQTLLSKSEAFSISIDTNGKLVFTVNSFSLTSYSVVTTNLPIQILCKFQFNKLEIFINGIQDAVQNFKASNQFNTCLVIDPIQNLTNTTLVDVPSIYSLAVDGNDKLVLTTPNGTCTSTTKLSNLCSIVTSSNGITWTERTFPVSANWSSVTYSGSQFVVVGYNSNIAMTSPDGITWTQRTLPAVANWSAVGYGNSKYVAVSSGSTIGAISSDGITWTQTTIKSGIWNTVSYGVSKFFVSGFGDEIVYAQNGYTNTNMYSSDGINWINTPILQVASWQYSCSYVGGFHSTSGYFHTLPDGTKNSQTTYYGGNSADGITWSFNGTLPTQGLTWTAIGINGPKLTGFAKNTTTGMVCNGGNNSWTNVTLPVSANWKSASYGNSTYCVIANNSSIALTSSDGSTWTQRTLPDVGYWNCLTFGNGVFVAVSGTDKIPVTAIDDSYSVSLFINGIPESQVSINNTMTDSGSSPLVIGPMTGILDDVFIAKQSIDSEYLYKLAYEVPFDGTQIKQESDFFDDGAPPSDVLNRIYNKEESKNDLDCYYSADITYTIGVSSVPTLFVRSSFITIDGNITLGGIPASRKVLLMEKYNKDIVRSTWSDPSTGYYSFSDVKYLVDYMVFCEDYETGNQASKKVIIGVPTNLDPLSGSSTSSPITSQFSGYISSFGIFKVSTVEQSLINNLFYSSNILGSFKIEGETYINNVKTQDISILLLDSSYNKIKSTLSDSSGNFSFLNIHYASYYILTTVDSLTNVIKGPILPTPM